MLALLLVRNASDGGVACARGPSGIGRVGAAAARAAAGSLCRFASSSSGTSSSSSSQAGIGLQRDDTESGQACESPGSAQRDVLVSRVAALEAEITTLKDALHSISAQGLRGRAGAGDVAHGGDGGDGGDTPAGSYGGGSGGPGGGEHGEPNATRLRAEDGAGGREGQGGGKAQGRALPEAAGARGRQPGGGSSEGAGQQQRQQGAERSNAPVDGEDGGAGGGGGSATSRATEAAAEGLARLHPKITRLVQSGYLESLHHLRQRIMVDEWEGGGRQRALRRGVAEFEAQLAEGKWGQPGEGDAEGGQERQQQGREVGGLSWEQLSALYEDPANLSIIRDPRLRSAARAVLHRQLDERHEAVRQAATAHAKELADGVSKSPANLLGGLWGLLPLPAFLRGK